MRRVSIVGNSGAGKSTLGRAAAHRLGVPYIELDRLCHQPGWTELPDDEFRARVGEVVVGDGWVIDGNYRSHIGDLVLGAADTVVWLDLPKRTVRARIVRRTLRRVLTRQELWNGNREPFTNLYKRDPHENIIVWSWTQHDRYVERYEREMAETAASRPDLAWVRLRSPREATAWLNRLGGPA